MTVSEFEIIKYASPQFIIRNMVLTAIMRVVAKMQSYTMINESNLSLPVIRHDGSEFGSNQSLLLRQTENPAWTASGFHGNCKRHNFV